MVFLSFDKIQVILRIFKHFYRNLFFIDIAIGLWNDYLENANNSTPLFSRHEVFYEVVLRTFGKGMAFRL